MRWGWNLSRAAIPELWDRLSRWSAPCGGRALAEAGLRVTAEGTKGSGENIRRLASGELDFAISNSAAAHFGDRGEDGWGRAHPIRAVVTLAPNLATLLPRLH